MPSPTCEVKDGGGAYQSTALGVNVTPGNTITVKLLDSSVESWALQCLSTDDLSSVSAVNAALVIDPVTKTATFPAPASVGRGYRFQTQVERGNGPDGVAKPSYTATFAVYTLVSGRRVVTMDEETEAGPFGWSAAVNAIIRNPSSAVASGLAGTVQTTDGAGNFTGATGIIATAHTFKIDGTTFKRLTGTTTGAASANLVDDAAAELVLDNAATYVITADVVASRSDAAGLAHWKREYTVQTTGGVATIVDNDETTTLPNGETCTVVASITASLTMRFAATGVGGRNFNYNVMLTITKVAGA